MEKLKDNDKKKDNKDSNKKMNKEDILKRINGIKEKINILNKSTISTLNSYFENINNNYYNFKNNLEEKIDNQKIFNQNIKNKEILNERYKENLHKLENSLYLNNIVKNSIKNELRAYQNILSEKDFFSKYFINDYFIKNQDFLSQPNIFTTKDNINIEKICKSIKDKKLFNFFQKNCKLTSFEFDNSIDEIQKNNFLTRNKYVVKLTLKNLKKEDLDHLFDEDDVKDVNQDNLIQSSILASSVNSSFNLKNNFKCKNLRKLRLLNCENNNKIYEKYFIKINKLYLRNINCALFTFNIYTKLIVLNLDNCNIGDYEFNKFWNDLPENLKILSLRNNKISSVSKSNSKLINIEELDFEYNNISSFPLNVLSNLPNIKLLDLSCNNYSFKNSDYDSLIKFLKKSQLLLFFGNLLFKSQIIKEHYFQYFNTNLKLLKYPLKKLNFQFFFDKHNFHLLKEIDLIPFQQSMIILNFNSCYLSNKQIFELLLNNMLLINLKELYLSLNELTKEFFGEYIKLKLHLFLSKLKILDLSFNPINFENKNEFILFENFIINNYSLKELVFKHITFENILNNYLKKQLNSISKDDTNNKEIPLNLDDEEFKGLFSNLKIIIIPKIYIKSLSNLEYTIKIKKYSKTISLNFKYEETL
jgi:hypothetical protein